MDPIQDAFFKAWGLPGLMLVVAGSIIVWLVRKIMEIYEQRLKEASAMADRYAEKLSESTATMREFTATIREMSSMLGRRQ